MSDERSEAGAVLRLLVAEDTRILRETLVTLFSLEDGIEVVAQVAAGTGIVPAALEHRPDVALLDIGMPDGDGYEVARRLRELPEMTPGAAYIAITGFGRPEDFERSENAGFFRHLVKPVDPSVLEAVLRDAFRARTAVKIS